MGRLVKLQLRNVFKSKYFYVCLVLSILMSVALTYLSSLIFHDVNTKAMPQIMDILNSEVTVISIVFLVLLSCFDFNEGTTKNIIARGYTRTQLLFSKYIVAIISLFTMIIVMILLALIVFSGNGMGYESIMSMKIVNNIFDILAHIVFFVTLAFLLEKHSSAIIACLLVPNILPLIFTLIDSNFRINISKMWLDGVSNKFLENPTWTQCGWTILFYLIYIAIFIIIGLQILNRKEIK